MEGESDTLVGKVGVRCSNRGETLILPCVVVGQWVMNLSRTPAKYSYLLVYCSFILNIACALIINFFHIKLSWDVVNFFLMKRNNNCLYIYWFIGKDAHKMLNSLRLLLLHVWIKYYRKFFSLKKSYLQFYTNPLKVPNYFLRRFFF